MTAGISLMPADRGRAAAADRFETRVARDVRVPTDDPAITLSADVYRPVTEDPVPALVSAYPYRKDLPTGSSSMAPVLTWFAARGYACVLLDLRGTGASDGIQAPVCHASEGDDLLTAIAWVAGREWCTGDVGMWGLSYGGVTTLRAASREPPALKAIMPMVCPADPERDAMFPNGARTDLLQRVWWAGGLLANQILPPMVAHTTASADARWRRRLHDTEPYLADLSRHVAGDPAWRARAIDPARIAIPAYCVGGWRDLYAASVVRTFHELAGPKKLLIGPWGHTMPQDAPHEPVDFLPMALRWWDHWLRGVDTGIMDEPTVTLHVEQEQAWHGFDGWPRTDALTVAAGADLTLRPGPVAEMSQSEDRAVIGVYEPDPTTGLLGGPQGLAGRPVGHPMDARDEAACLVAETEPIGDDVTLCGVGEVVVAARARGVSCPERLVARVAEVDRTGEARYVTGGVAVPREERPRYRITLDPIAWRLRAGARLRVLLSDGDFPRLTPLAGPRPVEVTSLALSVPTLSGAPSATATSPPVAEGARDTMAPGAAGLKDRFTITRDLVHDGIEVALGPATPWMDTPDGHGFQMEGDVHARVRRDAPDAAELSGRHTLRARMTTGERIRAVADVRCTQTSVWARGEVTIDGRTLYTNTWDILLPEPKRGARDG